MTAAVELHLAIPDRERAVAFLATLRPTEYDSRRGALADVLGCRVGSLDAEVRQRRPKSAAQNGGQGRPFEIKEGEVWPEPVDGALLLAKLTSTIRRCVVLPQHGDVALALWCLHTHAIEAADCAPIIALTSPEPRCGKSTVLALLSKLVRCPLTASNISPAALFRVIESQSPTLLIDEGDAFLKDNEPLRGILNSGHTRDSAYVLRCEGEDHEPKQFSTWGAKAIACIGRLPRTIQDRSITIPLRRKLPGELVTKLRDTEPGLFQELAAKCRRFAEDSRERLTAARPAIPEALNDRAADSWAPLFAIADLADGLWFAQARAAAVALSNSDADSESLGMKLLSDIRDVFDSRSIDRIASDDLLRTLLHLEECPGGDLHGKPLTARSLARLLHPFGILSGSVRLADGRTPKGYLRARFEDAFARYLPQKSATTPQPCKTSHFRENSSATSSDRVADQNTQKPLENRLCGVVADKNPPPPEEGDPGPWETRPTLN